MPHESTVAHEQRFVMESPVFCRSRTFPVMEEQEESSVKIDNKVCLDVVGYHEYFVVAHYHRILVFYFLKKKKK